MQVVLSLAGRRSGGWLEQQIKRHMPFLKPNPTGAATRVVRPRRTTMHTMTNYQIRASLSTPRIAALAAALPLALLFLAPLAPVEAATISMADETRIETAAPSTSNPERAAELEAQAWEMRDQINQRKQAARLYRQAAELRHDSDPMKVQSLRNASRMNFYAGRTNRALGDAAEAAQLALRQGDVVAAAHVHLDAAWLALEMGDSVSAEQHLADARLLAASPLLAQAQRADLMIRLAAPA
jgi:hypothetical protein